MSSLDRKLYDAEIDKLLKEAEEMIPNEMLPDLPYMELAPDVHDWYMFGQKSKKRSTELCYAFGKKNVWKVCRKDSDYSRGR